MTVSHLLDKFYVVTMISNPVRFESRYKLYKEFEERMLAEGVQLFTCEVQQGQRAFAVTDATNPHHLQVRTKTEVWVKENALNLMMQRLPESWEYVLFCDADIVFQRKDWKEEIVQQLQVYKVVQPFQTAIDLGPQGESMQVHQGFFWSWLSGRAYQPGYSNFHPGFCLAFRRDAIENLGGLIDRAVLGSGDRHMCMSLVGKGKESCNKKLHPNYVHMVTEWEERANTYIKQDVSYCAGTILHYYHGPKAARQYGSRWQILIDNQYDPYSDVFYDWQGLLQLDDDNPKLRDAIKRYFRTRQESSTTIELMP